MVIAIYLTCVQPKFDFLHHMVPLTFSDMILKTLKLRMVVPDNKKPILLGPSIKSLSFIG